MIEARRSMGRDLLGRFRPIDEIPLWMRLGRAKRSYYKLKSTNPHDPKLAFLLEEIKRLESMGAREEIPSSISEICRMTSDMFEKEVCH